MLRFGLEEGQRVVAELRRVRERVWVVDLECGLEEPWSGDEIGASLRVDEHNDLVHGRRHRLDDASVSASVDLEQREAAAAR